MKKTNNLFHGLVYALFAFLMVSARGYAQDSGLLKSGDKENTVQALLQSKDFVFKAQSVTPLGGRVIQLNSTDEVNLSGDTLRSALPYFGRAYSAPVNPSEGGILFTSTDFDYTLHEGKKGGWEIMIKPKDTRDVRQMSFSVSANGYASLQVISNNRQAISYYGYVSARKR